MGSDRFHQFDPLIQKWATHYGLPWRLVKAQVWQESDFNPDAVSSCGAMGLLQLMPNTAREMGLEPHEIFLPEYNLQAGIKYDRLQHDHFPEIPEPEQKLSFMLAAYNGGRGYINKALELAYEGEFGEVLSKSHQGKPGKWQEWGFASIFLSSGECRVKGLAPDYKQIWDYVAKIWEKYHTL